MNRRNFIRLLGSSLFVPVVEPQIKYFLPPLGGWQKPFEGSFADDVKPKLQSIYELEPFHDYLLKGRHYEYFIVDDLVTRTQVIDKYLNERAESFERYLQDANNPPTRFSKQ